MAFKFALLGFVSVLSVAAQAADWSDTTIGYRYAPKQSEPGVSDEVKKTF